MKNAPDDFARAIVPNGLIAATELSKTMRRMNEMFEASGISRTMRQMNEALEVNGVSKTIRQLNEMVEATGLNQFSRDLSRSSAMLSALEHQRAFTGMLDSLEHSAVVSKMSATYAELARQLDRNGTISGALRAAAMIETASVGRSLGTSRPAWFEDLQRIGRNVPLADALKDAARLSDLAKALTGPVAAVDLWGDLSADLDGLGSLRGHVHALDALQRTKRRRKHVDGYDEFGGIVDPRAAELEDATTVDRLYLPDESRGALVRADYFPLHLIAAFLREPTLLQTMPWRKFEELVAEIFLRTGAQDVVLMRGTKDGGKDIVARVLRNGIPVICYVQCKRYAAARRIGVETVRALLGTVRADGSEAQHGALVTSAYFTRDSRRFIASQSALEGHDLDGVTELLRGAYPSAGA